MAMEQETWYLINDSVVMCNGEIFNNPFSTKYEINPMAIWVLENRHSIMREISRFLHQMNGKKYGVTVEDCYQYVFHYFLFEDMYKQNFIPLVSGEINIETYCKVHIKNLVRNYIQEVRQQIKTTIPIVEDVQSNNQLKGVFIGKIETEPTYKSMIHNAGFEEIDQTFQQLCHIGHDYFFYLKGYIPFDVEKYFTYMYFDIQDVDIMEHFQEIAKKTGIQEELLRVISATLREDVNNSVKEAQEILLLLKELIQENKTQEWKPKLLRKEE